MRRLALLTIAAAATALGGCAATYPTFVLAPRGAPPSDGLTAYGTPTRNAVAIHEPDAVTAAERPRVRRVASRATQSDAPRETAPGNHPRYSTEWWQEQDRADEAMKRRLNICRGC